MCPSSEVPAAWVYSLSFMETARIMLIETVFNNKIFRTTEFSTQRKINKLWFVTMSQSLMSHQYRLRGSKREEDHRERNTST